MNKHVHLYMGAERSGYFVVVQTDTYRQVKYEVLFCKKINHDPDNCNMCVCPERLVFN